MNIKSNSIVSSNGNESVNLPNGFSVGSIIVQGNLNLLGITTSQSVNSNEIFATSVNVESLSGNGSGLTNTPNIQSSRVIALKYIFADPPLRA